MRCGQQAAKALADRIGRQTVTCDPRAIDQDNRVVAVCSAGGDELNGWMVRQGMALAYRQISTTYVRREKKAAKEAANKAAKKAPKKVAKKTVKSAGKPAAKPNKKRRSPRRAT